MSLHIQLLNQQRKSTEDDKCIGLAISLLNTLQKHVELKRIRLLVEHEQYMRKDFIVYEEDTSETSLFHIQSLIRKYVSTEQMSLLEIEFKFILKTSNVGFIRINNEHRSKVYGKIELDIYPNKFEKDGVTSFDEVLKEKIIDHSILDRFFHEQSLDPNGAVNRAYVDVNEEGDTNPLDIVYEYDRDISKTALFINSLNAIEYLSAEDDELYELYYKLRGSDKNYLSGKLWQDPAIKSFVLSLGEKVGVTIEEGSLRIYAEDAAALEKFYRLVALRVFAGIYRDIPSLNEKIEEFKKGLEPPRG